MARFARDDKTDCHVRGSQSSRPATDLYNDNDNDNNHNTTKGEGLFCIRGGSTRTVAHCPTTHSTNMSIFATRGASFLGTKQRHLLLVAGKDFVGVIVISILISTTTTKVWYVHILYLPMVSHCTYLCTYTHNTTTFCTNKQTYKPILSIEKRPANYIICTYIHKL